MQVACIGLNKEENNILILVLSQRSSSRNK
jgi:hypothetical protein